MYTKACSIPSNLPGETRHTIDHFVCYYKLTYNVSQVNPRVHNFPRKSKRSLIWRLTISICSLLLTNIDAYELNGFSWRRSLETRIWSRPFAICFPVGGVLRPQHHEQPSERGYQAAAATLSARQSHGGLEVIHPTNPRVRPMFRRRNHRSRSTRSLGGNARSAATCS